MPAGGCRSIFGVSFGRCQPMCHTHQKGNYYAQGHSVSPPHPRRATMNPKKLLQTGKPVVCRLCRVFLFCLCLVLVQGRELKWAEHATQPGILVHYILISI